MWFGKLGLIKDVLKKKKNCLISNLDLIVVKWGDKIGNVNGMFTCIVNYECVKISAGKVAYFSH